MTDRILAYTEHADIISVLMGVNDFNRDLPLGTIDDFSNTTVYGALNMIASHFKTYYKDSFVFFMTPYKQAWGDKGSYTDNAQGYKLLDVANAVKEVVGNYGYPVLDLFNVGKYELEMYNAGSDGLHPSQEFFENYTAPQIAQFIKDNYKK
jgi:lysophospholipase L1-like esterase